MKTMAAALAALALFGSAASAEDTIKRPWGAFFADQYILSVGKTRYVGEEVAAVAAIDPDARTPTIRINANADTIRTRPIPVSPSARCRLMRESSTAANGSANRSKSA